MSPQATRMIGKREFNLKTDIPPDRHAARIEPTAPLETAAAATPAMSANTAPDPAAVAPPPAAAGDADGAPHSQQNPFFNRTAFPSGDYPPVWYDSPPYPAPYPARRLPRAILAACIFAIGAASGAAAFWWLQNPPSATANPDPRLTNSAGELPYDGATTATAAVATTPADASAPAASAEPQELPSPSPIPAAISQPESATAGADGTAPAPAPAGRGRHKSRAHQPAASGMATPRPEAGAGQARTTRSGEPSLTPLMLAQCARMADAVERQQCRREVCNGKWGEHGCPPPPAVGAAE